MRYYCEHIVKCRRSINYKTLCYQANYFSDLFFWCKDKHHGKGGHISFNMTEFQFLVWKKGLEK